MLESQLAAQQPPFTASASAHNTSNASSFLSTTTNMAMAPAGSLAMAPPAAGAVGGALTLRRLAVWVEEPLSRLRLLSTLCDRYGVYDATARAVVDWSCLGGEGVRFATRLGLGVALSLQPPTQLPSTQTHTQTRMHLRSLEHVRGGALASVLVAHGQQGDPAGRRLVRRILGRVCLPLFEMVRR